ncbi:MAG: GGDEF domain-containing protein [Pirellulaceae bacterium]|jgi:diguanylate cyclase (GGDEF)-like protein|nr:GGDEF domain-containing protein [Pirellulaceae bacterium]
MTAPAQIVVATADANRLRDWTAALSAARCHVRSADEMNGHHEVDVVVTDEPLASTSLLLDEDRLARGQIGLVAVGRATPADVSLPDDCSPREVRLACLLLAEIVRLRRQREASRRKEKVLAHLAMSDPLTGLPNRRAWEQLLHDRLIAEVPRQWCALVLLDIDEFKHLNDEAGFLAGDEFLKDVAARLNNAVRRRNAVARLGGDEFAILLEGIEADQVPAMVEQIRIQAGGARDAKAAHALTLSAGWVVFSTPCTKADISSFMQAADANLRAAKQAGRNCTRPAT